jgi:hypothetical protein
MQAVPNQTDFKDALRLIIYQNTAEPLTPGPRTVQVQFTTASGQSSNIATDFIDVIELPQTLVDLGPDQQACDGRLLRSMQVFPEQCTPGPPDHTIKRSR